tara:strand:- start:25200 stop:31388 length:6189 start_codon:yes stop_codon:yes gene_type:complete
MATINHSSGADIIVPSNGGTTYRGLGGDDTYILSNSIAANAAITIVDTSGANTIQLVDGLSISSSKFAADAVQLTLSNGAVVTINGASNFSYELGGNSTSGVTGSTSTLSGFATTMGVATLPTSGSTAGSSDVTISNNGISSTASPTFTVTKDTSKVAEGGDVTFTITASSAVSADTSFSWSAMGDTNGSTVTAADNSDIETLSGSAVIASGSTTTTFSVGAVSDAVVEGLEGMKVSIFDSSAAAVSSDVVLIDNTGSAATTQSFSGTTGVNNFTGGDGNDSFDFSTAASFQDIDAIDGAGGTDTITISYAGTASLKPELENVEVNVISNTGANTTTLTINAVDTASGYDTITNLSSTGALTINNLQSLPTLVKMNSAGDDFTLDFEVAALAGDADNLSVTISGTGTSATLTLTADGTTDLETLTLNSTAQANTLATVTTADVDVTKLVVTGDQGLEITNGLSAEITEIDASGHTGTAAGFTMGTVAGYAAGITIKGGSGPDAVIGSAAGLDNISGGAGNDTITMTGLLATDTIDGGDGDDTISTDDGISSATVIGGVSNVETIKLTADGTIALAANVSATTFDFTDTDNQVLTLDEGYTNATTVVLATYLAGDTTNPEDSVTNLANVDLTVQAMTLGLDTELTLTGGTGTDSLNLYLAGNADDDLADSATGFENITLLDNAAGNTATTLTFGAYSAGTAKNITIDATALSAADTAALTIDASGVTAASTGKQITYTDGANATQITLGQDDDTATMGVGNDTVIGTSGANTIDMGAGNDSVTAGTGIESIAGGDGNDTLNLAGNLTALDTIDGGEGADTLILSGAVADDTILGGISNIETIQYSGAVGITLDSSISATNFDMTSSTNNVLTLNAGYTDAVTVYLTTSAASDATSNQDSVINGGGTTLANTTLTVIGEADAFDAGTTLTGGTGTDTLQISQKATSGNATAKIDGDITGFDKIVVTDTAGNNTGGVTLDIDDAAYATALDIDTTALDAGEADEVAASNATAAITVNAGEGISTIATGTKADTVNSGGGNDIINTQAGLDVINAGAGNDAITFDTEGDFLTTLGTSTVDGGAGTDSLTFSAAATLATSELTNISSIETLSLATGSTLTVNDAFLAANPGLTIQPGATSTIKASTATGDSLSTALNIAANAAGNLSLLGGTGDDSFTFYATETLTVLDTVNGGTGTDQIIVDIVDATPQAGVGVDTTAVLDTNISNIETVKIRDVATDDGGGSGTIITATVTVNSGYTGASLTIDGSDLDMHPTTLTGGERLTATASSNTVAEVVTMIGGAFGDSLTGGAGADTLTGNGGIDTLTGGAGNDIITGGTGDDSITPGAGIDHASGGAGNDTFTISTFTDFKTSGGAETLDGGEGTDTITFSEGAALTLSAPEMEALVGIETLNASDDIGNFQTTITLGNGFFTSNGSSTVTIDGNDTSNTAADHYIDLSSVSNGSAVFYPNNVATDADDSMYGGSGNDTWIVSGTAAAALEATDVFDGNGGTDTFSIVNTGAITAVIDFSVVSDVEQAVTSKDSTGAVDLDLGAVASTDTLPATFTVDGSSVVSSSGTLKFNKSETETNLTTAFTVTGGLNADTIYGAKGNDVLTGGAGVNVIGGNAGNDTITDGSGASTLAGDAGADTILGAGGDDAITGGAGNDSIVGGDGVDTITPGAGKDTVTLGSGKDTVIFTADSDSAGANFDVITDFVSGTDNLRLTHTMVATDSVFTLSDKGDAASDGTLPGILDGVIGSSAFITEGTAIAIDTTGDGLVNANDFKVEITGNTGLNVDDIDVYLTTAAASTVKTAGGADSIDGASAAAQTVYTYGGNDTIDMAGDADDTLWGGAGNDTIDVGATAGSDIIILSSAQGTTTVENTFTLGADGNFGTDATDKIYLNMDDTSDGTATGVQAVGDSLAAYTGADEGAYSWTALDTGNVDFIELEIEALPNIDRAELITDYSTGKATELFIGMATDNAGHNVGSITVDTAGDKFYIFAYDDGASSGDQGLYIYHANSSAVVSDTSITVNEVTFVAFIDDVADDLVEDDDADGIIMFDLTTIDSAY